MPDVDARTLARRIAHKAATLPLDVSRWHDVIADQILDGYPMRTGDDVGRASGVSDPTSRAAIANTTGTGRGYRPADELDVVLQELRIIDAALTLVDKFVRKRIVYTGTTPRCFGGHLDGAAIPRAEGGWYDEACENVADMYTHADGSQSIRRNGLCVACAVRYYRWRNRR